MNRRSFFSKFVAVAAGLLAIPKARAGWKRVKVGSPICPNDPLICGYDPAYGEDKQLLYIWHPHALPSNLSKINCDNLVIYQFKKDGSVVRV